MKKYIVGLAGALMLPALALAQSSGVIAMNAPVSSSAAVSALTSGASVSSGVAVQTQTQTQSCVPLNRVLAVGSTGTDVAFLQTTLENQGVLTMPQGVAKGYFGPATQNAVRLLQQKNNLETVGSVGPLTRHLVQNISCGGVTTMPTPVAAPSAPTPISVSVLPRITVLTPNGGEVWAWNAESQIRWTSNVSTGTVDLYLQNQSGVMCHIGTSPVANDWFDVIPASQGCTGSFGNPAPGKYKVSLFLSLPHGSTSDIGDAHDSSDNFFTIAPSTVSSITVTYPSGGEILNNGGKDVIATVTWTSSNVGNYPVEIDLLNSTGEISKTVATNLKNNGSYRWLYDATIPNGNYTLLVATQSKEGAVGGAAGRSGVFSITSNTSVPSATIDQSSLKSSSGTPTLTGYAYNVTQPFGLAIGTDSGDKVWGSGNVSVDNNRWSTTVSPALPAGTYRVQVYSNNVLLTTGTLVIGSSTSCNPVGALQGDLDGNGKLDGADQARMDAGYRNQLQGWSNGDLDCNGKIDGGDLALFDSAWNSMIANSHGGSGGGTSSAQSISCPTTSTIKGDANCDGAINSYDYDHVDNGYRNRLSGWTNGDFDGNGKVDGADYAIIDAAYNAQIAAAHH